MQNQNRDEIKRRNNLMRAFLSNKKLAKIFYEGIDSPIGSTKRQQAQSIFSVMMKSGGVKPDGMGGPVQFSMNPTTPTAPTTSQTGFNNILAFTPAPSFKTSLSTTPSLAPVQTPIQPSVSNLSNQSSNLFSSSTWPTSSFSPNYFNNASTSYSSIPVVAPKTTPVEPKINPFLLNPERELTISSFNNSTSSPFDAFKGITIEDFINPPKPPKPVEKLNPNTYYSTGENKIFNQPYVAKTPDLTKLSPGGITPSLGAQQPSAWGPSTPPTVGPTIDYSDLFFAPPKTLSIPTPGLAGAGNIEIPNPEYDKYIKAKEARKLASVIPSQKAATDLTNKLKDQLGLMADSSLGRSTDSNVPTGDWATNWAKYNGEIGTGTNIGTGTSTGINISTNTNTNIGTGTGTGTLGTGITTSKGGYGGEIVPDLASRDINSLTAEERQRLYLAQVKAEGSTLPNNPFGIKLGGATQHWVDEGLATIGGTATDGGKFLVFKDQATAMKAYSELLYGSGVYSGLTVEEAMRKWSTGSPTGIVNNGGGYVAGLTPEMLEAGSASGYALAMTNKQFGGNYEQHLIDLERKAYKDANLPELELKLSNLSNIKNNLKPTLEQYITGRDEYLNEIDGLIEKTEEGRKYLDMGDPAVNASYRKQIAYLYLLKGRQETRYGNWIGYAVDQYNTDLATAQTNYDNAYKRYETAVTQQGTLHQAEYTNTMKVMADAYTAAENAPINALNLRLLEAELNKAGLSTVANGLAAVSAGNTTNPQYWPAVELYTKNITKDVKATITPNDDGTSNDETLKVLDDTKIPPTGLIGFYTQNVYAAGDEAAMTESIRRALSARLAVAKSQGITQENAEIKKITALIDQLAADPRGALFAAQLRGQASFMASDELVLTDYITKNMSLVKNAASDLVSSYDGKWYTFGLLGKSKPGIQDKETWKAKNPGLTSDFLDSLYNVVNNNIQPGTAYAANPENYIKQLFASSDANKNAKELAERILTSGK